MGHREAIAAAIASLAPQNILDFGGGFGTLARLIAQCLPQAEISICEPYPPQHGVESCKSYPNIIFEPCLRSQSVDVLVSTDVLEHVSDPLSLLAAMVDAVKPGGHLFLASCFYPVIACHLPCTFHLRDTFDAFCSELGLDVLGPCEGSHATIYHRSRTIEPDWPRLRRLETSSKRRFAFRQAKYRYLSPLSNISQVLANKVAKSFSIGRQ